MSIAYCDGETPLDHAMAKEILESLTSAYQGHSWWVECRGGVAIIRHFSITNPTRPVGMVKHLALMGHDAGVRKREVIEAAGELLERAGLSRGVYEGQVVERLEGGEQFGWRPSGVLVPAFH